MVSVPVKKLNEKGLQRLLEKRWQLSK